MCRIVKRIGADGLMLLQMKNGFDFEMLYFNADGREGSMCGNGGRVVAAFAFREEITGKNMIFDAYDGEHEAFILEADGGSYEVKLTMKDVVVEQFDNAGLLVNTGSPHYVTRIDNLADYNVVQFGRQIRHDKNISIHGVNTNFMEKIDDQIFLRTYERGVEDETLSCGTGVTATAIAASLCFGGESHEIVTPGGKLRVNFKKAGNSFSEIELTGPVEFVYSGIFAINL